MGHKNKKSKKSISISDKLAKGIYGKSKGSKKKESEFESGLDQQFEKTLSLDLEVVFQRRLKENGFA